VEIRQLGAWWRRKWRRCSAYGSIIFFDIGVKGLPCVTTLAASMVEGVVCAVDRLSGDHLAWSRRWHVTTATSMAKGELARNSFLVSRCHPRHSWLWQVGVAVCLGGELRHWGRSCSPRVWVGWGTNVTSKSFAQPRRCRQPLTLLLTPLLKTLSRSLGFSGGGVFQRFAFQVSIAVVGSRSEGCGAQSLCLIWYLAPS
jgi:hypothetical protein